jgi:hypothetical protein
LESRGLVVFYSLPRSGESEAIVYWDAQAHPDFRQFLAAAEAAGARLITMYAREFDSDVVEDALERVSESRLDRDERHAVELRLKEMRPYDGFTCQIELAFSYADRDYIFDLRTEWFDELSDLLDEIEASRAEGQDEDPLGGFYSKN